MSSDNTLQLLGQEIKLLDQEESVFKQAYREVCAEEKTVEHEEHEIKKLEKKIIITGDKLTKLKQLYNITRSSQEITRHYEQNLKKLCEEHKKTTELIEQITRVFHTFRRMLKEQDHEVIEQLHLHKILSQTNTELKEEQKQINELLFGSQTYPTNQERASEAIKNQLMRVGKI